jgi:hypothetical protein
MRTLSVSIALAWDGGLEWHEGSNDLMHDYTNKHVTIEQHLVSLTE